MHTICHKPKVLFFSQSVILSQDQNKSSMGEVSNSSIQSLHAVTSQVSFFADLILIPLNNLSEDGRKVGSHLNFDGCYVKKKGVK